MPRFEWLQSILHECKLWIIRKRTAKLIAQIDDLTADIERAKRAHRGRRWMELKRQRLANERLSIEVRVLNLF
jgi:hypothetical protein